MPSIDYTGGDTLRKDGCQESQVQLLPHTVTTMRCYVYPLSFFALSPTSVFPFLPTYVSWPDMFEMSLTRCQAKIKHLMCFSKGSTGVTRLK
jgi:hypothetical protein